MCEKKNKKTPKCSWRGCSYIGIPTVPYWYSSTYCATSGRRCVGDLVGVVEESRISPVPAFVTILELELEVRERCRSACPRALSYAAVTPR